MKTRLLFLLPTILLCSNVFAQFTIDKNEFYYVGDFINMVPADPAGTSAGSAGTGVTWDFSALTPQAGVQTTYIDNIEVPFSTANLMFAMPNGKRYFVLENNTDTYLTEVTGSAPGGDTVYYVNLKLSRRPISYMTYYTDTYRVNVPSTTMHGGGYVTSNVDGSGTVITPRGTYSNVLRVKRIQSETDTLGAAITTTTIISYLWFDSMHRAPLLRIDSTIGVVGAGNTIMYQAASTGVAHVATANPGWRGHIQDDELTLFGNLIDGGSYHVTACNIVGEKIIDEQFIARANSQRFTSAKHLSAGIYMVTISPADNRALRHVIKVVK